MRYQSQIQKSFSMSIRGPEGLVKLGSKNLVTLSHRKIIHKDDQRTIAAIGLP